MTAPELSSPGFPIKLDIHQEIQGSVPELVAALGIDLKALQKHVHCPFENHEDRRPSFRVDARKARFYCSCTPRGGSMVDLVLRLLGHENASGAIKWIRAKLNCNNVPLGLVTPKSTGK